MQRTAGLCTTFTVTAQSREDRDRRCRQHFGLCRGRLIKARLRQLLRNILGGFWTGGSDMFGVPRRCVEIHDRDLARRDRNRTLFHRPSALHEPRRQVHVPRPDQTASAILMTNFVSAPLTYICVHHLSILSHRQVLIFTFPPAPSSPKPTRSPPIASLLNLPDAAPTAPLHPSR